MEPYHAPESSCFVLPLEPEPALVRYEPDGEGVVLFTLVYVPPAHRGTDASRRLLAFAFEHARTAGWRVRPTCSYIAGRYVPGHPEVHDVIAE